MKENKDIEIEQAEKHAEWIAQFASKIIKIIAKEEYIHGYKHGWEECKAHKPCSDKPCSEYEEK